MTIPSKQDLFLKGMTQEEWLNQHDEEVYKQGRKDAKSEIEHWCFECIRNNDAFSEFCKGLERAIEIIGTVSDTEKFNGYN